MKHAARVMIPARRGSIVSCGVERGQRRRRVGSTKSIASELGKHRIRVNCVSPYALATGLALAHLPEEERTEDVLTGFRGFVVATGLAVPSRLHSRTQNSYADAAVVVERTIGSIKTVASFTGEKKAISDYNKSLGRAYKSSVQEGLATGLGLGTIMFIMFCSYAPV